MSPPSASRFFGAVLLVAGSCIGAGMLALPVLTGTAGFIPAVIAFLLCWAFMVTTGVLLVEAHVACGRHTSMVTMAEKTLGPIGKVLAWVLFLFLFYSLGVAYLVAGTSLIQTLAAKYFVLSLPSWAVSAAMLSITGICIAKSTQAVDLCNRPLMVGLILSYLVMVWVGAPYVQDDLLGYMQSNKAWMAVPALVISFGFHNMVPSLSEYFSGHPQSLRRALVVGSLMSLVCYLVWEWLILGILPVEGPGGLQEALLEQQLPSVALERVAGELWVSDVALWFSFFAIATSYLAQSLSLVDFLADGLKVKKTRKQRVWLSGLALIPPFLFALVYPKIFLSALSLAGGFGAVILFGVLPVCMAWVVRYRRKTPGVPLVPGGRLVLVLTLLAAVGIFCLELFLELGVLS